MLAQLPTALRDLQLPLRLKLWDGKQVDLGPKPRVTLVVKDPSLVNSSALNQVDLVKGSFFTGGLFQVVTQVAKDSCRVCHMSPVAHDEAVPVQAADALGAQQRTDSRRDDAAAIGELRGVGMQQRLDGLAVALLGGIHEARQQLPVLAGVGYGRLARWGALSSTVALLGGLVITGRDGRMVTYAAMVLACAASLGWAGWGKR